MRFARHHAWIVLLLLGLAQGAGLVHTAIQTHSLSPGSGKVFHLHHHGGDGHDADSPPADPAPEDECQVFVVLGLSAAPSAPTVLAAVPGPAPDLAPWRSPDLAPVSSPFALWLLAPSMSPPALPA